MNCVEDWNFYSIFFDCNITSLFPQFINLLLILGGGAIIEARGSVLSYSSSPWILLHLTTQLVCVIWLFLLEYFILFMFIAVLRILFVKVSNQINDGMLWKIGVKNQI